jgi:putative membrane protein
MPYYYGPSMMFPGFEVFDIVIHVLFIAGIIWLILRFTLGTALRNRIRSTIHNTMTMNSALSILNERFAKGEIDKAEYEERKKVLTGEQ